MNSTTSERTLDVHGTQIDYAKATFRMALTAACIGLGLFLWPLREHGPFAEWESSDAKAAAWSFAILSYVIAAVLPRKGHTFLDFVKGQIVTLKYYGWVRTSDHRRPLTDFGGIAVRHVCHPGGDGPDTFAGSVGLKPTDGGAVFWLKEFPATQDEMPREAYEFAVTLQKRLPLPITVLGLEFLDWEETRFILSKDRDASSPPPPRKPVRSTPSGMNRTSSRPYVHR